MKKNILFLVCVILGYTFAQGQTQSLTLVKPASQKNSWSFQLGGQVLGYTAGRVEIAQISNLYNFALAQLPANLPTASVPGRSVVAPLPPYFLKTKGKTVPVFTVKKIFNLGGIKGNGQDSISTSLRQVSPRRVVLGAEVSLTFQYFTAFVEKSWLIYQSQEKPLKVYLAPRIYFAWDQGFPASPNWRAFLNQHAPYLSENDLIRGEELFTALTPTAFGTPLSVGLNPRIDCTYAIGNSQKIYGNFFLGYCFDMMTFITNRHQSNFQFGTGIRFQT
jgi:hypothetical protein